MVIDINLSKLKTPNIKRFEVRKNTLAMKIPYFEIIKARTAIEQKIGQKLSYSKSFKVTGEAHIQVITPLEMKMLVKYLTANQINRVARLNKIQASDIEIRGIGSAKNKNSETFFILIASKNLLKIRKDIFNLYFKKSKDPSGFDPYWYFPHITIGYTIKDLNESDGIIKSLANTYDKRFLLK